MLMNGKNCLIPTLLHKYPCHTILTAMPCILKYSNSLAHINICILFMLVTRRHAKLMSAGTNLRMKTFTHMNMSPQDLENVNGKSYLISIFSNMGLEKLKQVFF